MKNKRCHSALTSPPVTSNNPLTERYIKRKIRTLTLTRVEFQKTKPALQDRPHFLVWERGNAYIYKAGEQG